MKTPPSRLLVITDASRIGCDELLLRLEDAFSAGLRWVLVREPAADPEALETLLDRLRGIAPEGAFLSLSLYPGAPCAPRRGDIALKRGIRGLHAGRTHPSELGALRARWGGDVLLGYSAHSPGEAQEAFRAGADYVTLAPVFDPISKKGSRPLGRSGLEEAARRTRGPVFALGGVTPERAPEVLEAGAYGVAAIGAVLYAPSPGDAVRAFLQALAARNENRPVRD